MSPKSETVLVDSTRGTLPAGTTWLARGAIARVIPHPGHTVRWLDETSFVVEPVRDVTEE